MQSMPTILLRQSLRSSVRLSRTTSSSSHCGGRSGRTQFPPTSVLTKRQATTTIATRRNFSICRQCQLRSHRVLLYESSSSKNDEKLANSNSHSNNPSDGKDNTRPVFEGIARPENLGAHLQGPILPTGESEKNSDSDGNALKADEEGESNKDDYKNASAAYTGTATGTGGGGDAGGRRLPSSIESRRSQFSKRFSSLMDNLQSNIFVAGQHLNDLTGYSSIEALKKEIQVQGM